MSGTQKTDPNYHNKNMTEETTDSPEKGFTRSPEFLAAEVVHYWLSQFPDGVKKDVHISRGRKIDPESGIMYSVLEIRVGQQMEKVTEEPKQSPDPLPPIPPDNG